MLLMYSTEENYQLEQYEDLLDIELKRFTFSDIQEAVTLFAISLF
ncbi:hypothetical protein V7266_09420 [Neobacillus drentensis]